MWTFEPNPYKNTLFMDKCGHFGRLRCVISCHTPAPPGYGPDKTQVDFNPLLLVGSTPTRKFDLPDNTTYITIHIHIPPTGCVGLMITQH